MSVGEKILWLNHGAPPEFRGWGGEEESAKETTEHAGGWTYNKERTSPMSGAVWQITLR